MSTDISNPWIEIRDHRGRLLFKYNAVENSILYQRGSMVYDIIPLDKIRADLGFITPPLQIPPGAVFTIGGIDKNNH